MTTTLTPATTTTETRPTRLPLNTFAIGFGLRRAGRGVDQGEPRAAAAACGLAGLLVRRGGGLDLAGHRPSLLAADLFSWSPSAGRTLFLLALTASTVLAAWRLASWFEGRLDFEAMHPGYLLPTVAPGLVGADAAHVVGFHGLAWALFGVGVFFTVVMTAILVLRLAFHAPWPTRSCPARRSCWPPPAVVGLAWFTLHGHVIDAVAQATAGVGVLLFLVQVAMVPRYRRLRFSLRFWSFTFPLAAAVAWTEEWLDVAGVPGLRVLTGVLAVVLTAFIGAIAVASLRGLRTTVGKPVI